MPKQIMAYVQVFVELPVLRFQNLRANFIEFKNLRATGRPESLAKSAEASGVAQRRSHGGAELLAS